MRIPRGNVHLIKFHNRIEPLTVKSNQWWGVAIICVYVKPRSITLLVMCYDTLRYISKYTNVLSFCSWLKGERCFGCVSLLVSRSRCKNAANRGQKVNRKVRAVVKSERNGICVFCHHGRYLHWKLYKKKRTKGHVWMNDEKRTVALGCDDSWRCQTFWVCLLEC